ncbi:MAG: hypothetical protein AB7I18_01905 [Candidatus Berkiella sp.]
MLNTFKKWLGAAPADQEAAESSQPSSTFQEHLATLASPRSDMSVTDEEFHQSLARLGETKDIEFLLSHPYEKLRYRLTEGEYQGCSYVWLITYQACYGRLKAFEHIYPKLTLDDLRTAPHSNHGKTVLWVLCLAAKMGYNAPLLMVLEKFHTQLTNEDLNAQVADHSVRNNLIALSEKNSIIKELMPDLFSDSDNELSDDSCHSANTLKGGSFSDDELNDDLNDEESNDSCHSAGTVKNDDDDDTAPLAPTVHKSGDPEVGLRMYSHSTKRQARLRKWKERQNELTAQLPAPAPDASNVLSPRKRVK